MQHLIKASTYSKFADRAIPTLLVIAVLSLIASIYFALFISPPDYQQGEFVRIMYVHVPAAWMSLGIYLFISVSACSYLVWRNPLSKEAFKAALPIGTSFAGICLLTGMLWGKPIWGVYWVWDARLTSMLLLFFQYLGLIALLKAFDDEERGVKMSAILTIVGIPTLVLIRFSVIWWNTLHQPASVMRLDSPAIHNDILIPLLAMFFSFLIIFFMLVITKVRTVLMLKKIERNSL
jgi:heme exporter protein C